MADYHGFCYGSIFFFFFNSTNFTCTAVYSVYIVTLFLINKKWNTIIYFIHKTLMCKSAICTFLSYIFLNVLMTEMYSIPVLWNQASFISLLIDMNIKKKK